MTLDAFTLFRVLGPGHYHLEETHSDIFAYLLSPSSEVGAILLQHFVRNVLNTSSDDDLDYQHAEVKREVQVVGKRRGRIDILVNIPSGSQSPLYLVIENKLSSEEHGDQLGLYFDAYSQQRAEFIYLSLMGQTPSHPGYHAVSYAHIAEMLSDVLQAEQVTIKREAQILIYQYVQFLRQLPDSDSSPGNPVRRAITSYLKDLIHHTEGIRLDPAETYQDTWVGMIPDLWDSNEALLRIKVDRQVWGLAFHIAIHSGINIEFYWHSNDEFIAPTKIYDCLKRLPLSCLHPPYQIGSGVTHWESVYTRNILESADMKSVIRNQHFSDTLKEHVAQQLNAFRDDARVLGEALFECSNLYG